MYTLSLMDMMVILACAWTLQRVAVADASCQRSEIFVGVLFDVQSLHLRSLLEETFDKLNKDQTEVLVSPKIVSVDLTDSFVVSNAMCDLITNDVATILGVTNVSSLATIQSYSNTFQVPFVTIGTSHKYTTPSFFQLTVRPAHVGAIVDVLQSNGYTKAVYIYDSDEGLMRIQDLFQSLNSRELLLDLDVRRVTSLGGVIDVIRYLSRDDRSILLAILDVERNDLKEVLSELNNDTDIAYSSLHIITVTLDILDVLPSDLRLSTMNISGFQLVTKHDKDYTLTQTQRQFEHFTQNAGYSRSSSEGLMIDAITVVHHAIRWAFTVDKSAFMRSRALLKTSTESTKCTNFVVEKMEHGPLIMHLAKQVQFKGVTGNIAFDSVGRRTDYKLNIYQSTGGLPANKIAEWHPDHGIHITSRRGIERTVIYLINNTSPVTYVHYHS